MGRPVRPQHSVATAHDGKTRAISLLFPHTATSPSHVYLDFIAGVT